MALDEWHEVAGPGHEFILTLHKTGTRKYAAVHYNEELDQYEVGTWEGSVEAWSPFDSFIHYQIASTFLHNWTRTH